MQTEIKLNQILIGKSEERLKEFLDNFFDGIITDPPYEINFMGETWDASGIAYNVELWKEVLRTAKPGSFLFCFGGTRTFHRVACAIEDAGWIIRDQMMWLYGEGFPKSTNIGKQLDKEAGVERVVVGNRAELNGRNPKNHTSIDGKSTSFQSGWDKDITIPATNITKLWDGYGTGLKPAWEPIIVAMKPLEKGLTYAQNAKKWGVAGLNIDGGRIGISQKDFDNNMSKISKEFTCVKPFGGLEGKGSALEPNPEGRWPANVILSHSPDCVCVGTKIINEGAPEGGYNYTGEEYKVKGFVKICKPQASSNRGQETVEVYACVPDCPIRIMDGQSEIHKDSFYSGKRNQPKTKNSFGKFQIQNENPVGYNGNGGASRFFYCAKAKRSEKEAGLIGFVECVKCEKYDSEFHTITDPKMGEKTKERCTRNNHPTVKPLDLMKYLCALIKMPNNDQVILDPFCGSGTTLVAAEQLNINYIGIEQDSDSFLIADSRIGV